MRDDITLAWRILRHSPGYALSAILTLGLAVGANTAVLSIADAVLFRPLPYTDPDRVFVLGMLNRETGARFASIPSALITAIDAQHQGLSATAHIESRRPLTVPGADGAEAIAVASATANYFEVLGVRPALGRLFDATDGRYGQPAMLTYAAWQQRFGGRSDVLGRATLGTDTFDVVGVLPRGFIFPTPLVGTPEIVVLRPPPSADTATPSVQTRQSAVPPTNTSASGPAGVRRSSSAMNGTALYPVVRLDPTTSRAQAQAEIESIVRSLTPDAKTTPVLDDVRTMLFPVGRPMLRFLLAAALLVLLLGCSNLANMLLARTRQRARELGVRAALGASTARLVRPIVIEGVMIGVLSAALALVLATATFETLLRQVPAAAYRTADVGVDLRVAVFALALGIGGGIAFAIIPVWHLWRFDVRSVLLGTDQQRSRARTYGRPMVVVQVALAVVLVFGTAIAGRALVAVLNVDLGFNADNVITVNVSPADLTDETTRPFFLRLMAAVGQRGDVLSVGAASALPLGSNAPDDGVRAPNGQLAAGIVYVMPGFFEATGMRLQQGRFLTQADVNAGHEVAVVTESAARALMPGRAPLGESFENSGRNRFVVVGVVTDVVSRLDRPAAPLAYVLPQQMRRAPTVVVRTRGKNDALLKEIKRVAAALAPTTPVTAAWWDDAISGLTAYRNPRFQALVLGAFATLAVALTALGIFAVVTFLITARTREFGVRLALGGTPASLLRMVLKQIAIPVVFGIVVGLIATRGLARLAEAQLFQVQTSDPVTLMLAALTVMVAALLAAYLPARRAGQVDPATTLRVEA
jgi:predicted permease